MHLPDERDGEEWLKERAEPCSEAEKRGKASSVITNCQSVCRSIRSDAPT